MRTAIAASYRLGILGYGAGMTLSLFGEVPAALLFVTTASLLAAALFLTSARRGVLSR
jgi:hypothetical protein